MLEKNNEGSITLLSYYSMSGTDRASFPFGKPIPLSRMKPMLILSIRTWALDGISRGWCTRRPYSEEVLTGITRPLSCTTTQSIHEW